MRRQRQTLEEIIGALSPIAATWEDDHARAVIASINSISSDTPPSEKMITQLLDTDFKAGLTVAQLALGMSKDQFTGALREALGEIGVKRYQKERASFVAALVDLGILKELDTLVHTPVTWKTILVERLKGGRGSAIKGQQRGRFLEDFVESIVREVFGKGRYKARCRFTGAGGTSTEKTDFAIPNAADPAILIEVKAYGATGSKQTDILGDIGRIVEEKRNDTYLLLVTDGVTWKARLNDLRKLVEMQNQGEITRIYTTLLADSLRADLTDLKASLRL